MKKFLKNIWVWIVNLWKIMIGFLSPVLRMAKKVFKKVFGTVVVLSFLVVPFLNNNINHSTAHWLWYPALTFIILSLIMDWFHKLKPVFDSPIVEFARKWGEALAVFAMISVFVFNYYDMDEKWLWVIFAYIAVFTPCFFLSLLVFDVKQNGKDTEKHQKSLANIVKNIALYWFVDLFYMSVFNYWIIYIENQTFNTMWLSLQFVFGILSLVIITFNLTQVFLNGQRSLWFFMALEFVLALIICGYLIFIIPNCNIQEIVLTIASALLGGILTLVGVAWTIKKGDSDRRETQQLTLKPWIFLMQGYLSQEEKKKLPKYIFTTSGLAQNDAKRFCVLKNTDNGIAILKEISSKRYRYIPIGDAIVDKNSVFYLYVDFEDDDEKEELRLTIEDVLHNEYNYKLSATEYPNVINTLTEEQYNEQHIF